MHDNSPSISDEDLFSCWSGDELLWTEGLSSPDQDTSASPLPPAAQPASQPIDFFQHVLVVQQVLEMARCLLRLNAPGMVDRAEQVAHNVGLSECTACRFAACQIWSALNGGAICLRG